MTGADLKQYRRSGGLTVAEVAATANVTVRAVERIESRPELPERLSERYVRAIVAAMRARIVELDRVADALSAIIETFDPPSPLSGHPDHPTPIVS